MMRFAMVIDAVVHEDDIRSALGLEPAPGGDAQYLLVISEPYGPPLDAA